jgi:hypothetical protein
MHPAHVLALALGLAGTLMSAAACDRNIEPYVPGEKPEAPDLSRIFPEGAERAAARPASRQPEQPRGRRALGLASSTDGAPEGAGPPIRGQVVISPELADRIPAGAVLFLIVRRAGGGPPFAVQRIANPRFPFSFELGPDDRMVSEIPFAGPMSLSARLDGDGNAMTRTPGDLQGSVDQSVEPGSEGVQLLIDELL